MKTPMKSLNLRLEDSPVVMSCLRQLLDELKARGLKIKPKFYIADEWFCADRTTTIALPFYLFAAELRKLHRQQVGAIEGKSRAELMRYLRHEMGHVMENAYQTRRLKKRKEIFGNSKQYPDYYRPIADAQNYVANINHTYAQAHPDEDFAETFAVWLDPKSNWQQKYQNKAVLKKLNYMDELMLGFRNKKPKFSSYEMPYSLKNSRTTLAEFYREQRKHLKFTKRRKILQKVIGDARNLPNLKAALKNEFKLERAVLNQFCQEIEHYCRINNSQVNRVPNRTNSAIIASIKRNDPKKIFEEFSWIPM